LGKAVEDCVDSGMVEWKCAASLGAGMPLGEARTGNVASVGDGMSSGEVRKENTGAVPGMVEDSGEGVYPGVYLPLAASPPHSAGKHTPNCHIPASMSSSDMRVSQNFFRLQSLLDWTTLILSGNKNIQT
jgi:hypothetical protein